MKNRHVLLIAGGLVVVLLLTAGLGTAAALLWLTPTTAAQQRVTPAAEVIAPAASPGTVTVVGEGTVSLRPDVARATVGVETSGTNVQDAVAEAGEVMAQVLAALKAQGIADKDIQTSGFSVWTERGPTGGMFLLESDGPQMTYRVSNNVTVVIRDLDEVGAVLDAAIAAGANTVHGVSFGLDDASRPVAEARRRAAEDARARAAELAELHGAQLGEVIAVSEVVGDVAPYPRALGMGAAMVEAYDVGPFSPGETQYTMRLQVVYGLR